LDAAVAADPVERNEAKYSSQQANRNTARGSGLRQTATRAPETKGLRFVA
jgi:hypothetical protein